MTKIKFCSFGGYRLFCDAWWNDLSWYVIGVSMVMHWGRDEGPWWKGVRWGFPGWVHDIKTYWHRARYGWAPRDTWGLDHYLNRVLAGSLVHLADTTHGAPAGYGLGRPPRPSDSFTHTVDLSDDGPESGTNFAAWDADLRRWANAFSEDPSDVEIYDKPNYEKHHAEEQRRRAAVHEALKEIEPWWEALWD